MHVQCDAAFVQYNAFLVVCIYNANIYHMCRYIWSANVYHISFPRCTPHLRRLPFNVETCFHRLGRVATVPTGNSPQ